jgi:hypothetical protein
LEGLVKEVPVLRGLDAPGEAFVVAALLSLLVVEEEAG